MKRVIISVRQDSSEHSHDIEVATDLPVADLITFVPRALGWPLYDDGRAGYEVVLQPPGRVLRDDETLSEALAWDGSALVFRARSAAASGTAEPPIAAWKKVR